MPVAINETSGAAMYLDESGEWQPAKTAINPQTKEMLAYDGNKWVEVPRETKGVLNYLDDAARAIAQGFTFGRADELAATVNPAINRALGLEAPETYEAALAQEHARDEAMNPYLRTAGEIAGAVGATIAAAPLAGVAAATRAGQALTALPRTVQFAGLGAAEGALMGSGQAKEGERLQGAMEGAVPGAVGGTVAPHIATGVSRLAQRIRHVFRNPEARAGAELGRAMLRDDMTPADIRAAMAAEQMDRPGVATIADIGGENVRGLVERVAQTPGAGLATVVPRLTAKQQTQAGRIGRDLRSMLGADATAHQRVQTVMQLRAEDASPVYRTAFAQHDRSIRSPEIDRLMSSDLFVKAMKRAISSGKDRAVREGFGDFNPAVRVTDDGRVRFGRTAQDKNQYPNLQYWDQVKRELDQMGSHSKREGLTDTEQNARGLARLLRSELDRLTADPDTGVSTYNAARNAWAGHSSYLDSIDQGRNIFNTRMSAEEWLAEYDALEAVNQDAFRIGAVSTILARMENNPSKIGDMTKYLRSPGMRARISGMMPTEELALAWNQRLDYEVRASELTGQALGNSATARRLAERADAEDVVGDLVIDALSGAPNATLLRRVLTTGPRWLRDSFRSRTDAELGEILTNPYRAGDLDRILQQAALPLGAPASNVAAAGLTAASVPMAMP